MCVGYTVNGKRTDEMPMTQSDIHRAEPIYEELPGWWEDNLRRARVRRPAQERARLRCCVWKSLPELRFRASVVGPGRDQTIVRRDILA